MIRQSWPAVVVACIAALSTAAGPGAASGRAQPPSSRGAAGKGAAERPVPFGPGETLAYDVSWSSHVTAGTATVTVQEKKPSYGSVAYYIVAEGRPTPLLAKLYALYYKLDSLLDAYTLLPQRGSVYSEEGKRHRMKVTLFDHPGRKASYEIRTATVVRRDVPLPLYSQDVLSAVYVLRALPLEPGLRLPMPVCDSGQIYTVRITVGAREPVDTGIGQVTAWRIVPVVADAAGRQVGRGMAIWISDDRRRLPVKMEAELAVGSFVLTLTAAK